MASNFTCRACIRSLSRGSNLLTSVRRFPLRTSVSHPNPVLRSLSSSILRPQKALEKEPSPASESTLDKTSPVPDTASPEPVRSTAAELSTIERLASGLRERATGTTETYVAYGVTELLYKECLRKCDYSIPQALEKGGVAPKNAAGEDVGVGTGWFFETLGLTPTFNQWAQITFLHMYMLTVRFRLFPAQHQQPWHQHLIDHFFYDAEDRLAKYHGMIARGVRQKVLKDLFEQWRAVILAYDEGIVKGDAVWAAAIWRNIFKGADDVDVTEIAKIVSYLRREIQRLDIAEDRKIASGQWRFVGNPGEERATVMVQSKLMKEAP